MRQLLIPALAMSVFAACGSTAMADVNPTGGFGDNNVKWKPEWSKAFFDCMNKIQDSKKLIEAVQQNNLSDVGGGKKWCPDGDLSKESNAKLFYLSILVALAKPESGYNEAAYNPNGATAAAVGLFQIGANDAKSHQCETPDGESITTEEQLKVGTANICCAVKIASDNANGKAGTENQTSLATGKNGIFGAFWQPMREGTGGDGTGGAINDSANSTKIKEKVADACKDVAAGNAGNDFTSEEIAMAGATGSGNYDATRLAGGDNSGSVSRAPASISVKVPSGSFRYDGQIYRSMGRNVGAAR